MSGAPEASNYTLSMMIECILFWFKRLGFCLRGAYDNFMKYYSSKSGTCAPLEILTECS